MSTRVLVVDDNPLKTKLVTAVLERDDYEIHTASGGAEALGIVDDIMPDFIILDVMMPGMNGYEVCRKMRQQPSTANLPILMLTAQDTLAEKIQGYEAGADDYMTTPFQAEELQARMKALLIRAAAQKGQVPAVGTVNGKVISLFSLRGGVGASTLATNIAVGLAQIWSASTALVDLSLLYGQSALLLNLSLRHSWADLTESQIEFIDIQQIENAMLKHTSGVSVLAAPLRLEQSELISAPLVAHVIKLLQQHYHYVVLDLAHDLRDTTLAGLDASDEILSIVTPEIVSISSTTSTLDLFVTLGYPKDNVRLVLNNIFEKGGLARAEIESALKRQVKVVVPYMPREIIEAINSGQPPILKAPSKQPGALFEDLAYVVSKDEHKKTRPEQSTISWQRVIQRLQQRRRP